VQNGCVLPSQYAIDYESMLSTAPEGSGANAGHFLREELPFKWRDAYVGSVARATNLVRFQFRTFEYILNTSSPAPRKEARLEQISETSPALLCRFRALRMFLLGVGRAIYQNCCDCTGLFNCDSTGVDRPYLDGICVDELTGRIFEVASAAT
jgi:hypothetical protein